jgi:hypothetical protein
MAFPGTLQIDYATPYETGTTKLYTIGQRAESPDGSTFRYAEKDATGGVANKLQQSSVPVANWTTQAHTVALAVGDTEISFKDGGTAFTVNQMEGGTIMTEETDDLGHIYRVKSNVVTAANETVCQLEDGVTVQVAMAVAANNVLTASLNPWMDILLQPAINTAFCCGVPRVVIAANAYGWVQTRGVTSCLADGATAILAGNEVRPSEDDDGAVCVRTEEAVYCDYQDIGVCMVNAVDGDFVHVFLKIE